MKEKTTLNLELAEYRRKLQTALASEAAAVGLLKDSMRTISGLSALVRPFFEACVRSYHARDGRVDPLALLGLCCFAGAAAAHLWEHVGEDLLSADLFALLSRG